MERTVPVPSLNCPGTESGVSRVTQNPFLKCVSQPLKMLILQAMVTPVTLAALTANTGISFQKNIPKHPFRYGWMTVVAETIQRAEGA